MTEKDVDKELKNSQEKNEHHETNVKEVETEQEESTFLNQWHQRHQEYLEKQRIQKEEEEKEAVSEQSKKEDAKKKSSEKASSQQLSTVPLEGDNPEEKAVKQVQKRSIPRAVVLKSLPVFFTAFLSLLLSIYFLSPLSKEKQLQVTGNSQVSADQILKDSRISTQDYTVTTLLNKDGYARNVVTSSPWIKSATIQYQFPNTFTISVEEYSRIGYVETDGQYYAALSSGEVASTPTASEEMPAQATIIHLTDKDLIKELLLQLAQVDQQIVANIQDISLTPTTATSDLLTLKMYDGNTVLVPLSEITRKLPYYLNIAAQLTVSSTIDMEVGIFSYAS